MSEEKEKIIIRRTVDGQEAATSQTTLELERARASLRQMEARSRRRLRSDRYLWGIYLMLMVFSVIEVFSASGSQARTDNVYEPLTGHILHLIIGVAIVLFVQNLHYKFYRRLAWWIAGCAIALLIYGNTHGVVANEAMRAIRLPGFTLQPPEIAKLALVVILARVLGKYQERHGVRNRGIVIALLIMGVFGTLLYTNGFTNAALVCTVGAAMFIIAGTQMRKLLVLFLIGAGVGAIVYLTKFSDDGDSSSGGTATEMVRDAEGEGIDRSGVRKGRISSFLEPVKPTDTVTDQNRQVFYAKMSQAHGGVLGNGPGNSRESARLPLAFSDYIYSIVVEDTGFVGGVILLVLYVLLLARAGVIATKCSKAFPALLITGCATLIVTQALIHMCIVVGLAPVSGQPLPFISKGGTSIFVMSMALGMMLSVSKFAVQNGRKADADIALKQAVDDVADTAANPSQLNTENNDPLTY